MRIATWNVNSVKARLPNVLEWLKEAKPDVVLLQEIKCETQNFPALEFESAGYKSKALGQKSYNGVAILSRHEITDVVEHLPEAGDDVQSRYIEATVKGVRVASIYLPNGNPTDTEKFPYKLAWLKRLQKHAAKLLQEEKPVVLGGDYNVIPEDIDVYAPERWVGDALFRPESRAAFRQLQQMGYTEAFRSLHPQKEHAYTFWDYQAGAWQNDNGIRIDHFLLSPEAADRMTNCFIDRTPRGKEKASDHTPVLLELKDVA
ncbi:MAG TPA: exodeoxyribonuclease III [Alphaproteobacteria bacterium]|nr:exodeoxyribonuclease III [Alphaproteobacteria bacterium]